MLGISVGNKSTWMYQKRFCKFPVTVIIHWTYLLNILKSVSVNVSINPASHIFPIDNRLADVMLLKNLAVVASFGGDGMSSWALSDEIMSAPLGQIALSVGVFYV